MEDGDVLKHESISDEHIKDEYFTQLLMEAVSRRPVLYDVHLPDYRNKNKKGEAFKSVQEEMKQLGCSEQQIQNTYKRWISLKRKFRVEYLKRQLAAGGDATLDEEPHSSTNFPEYKQLRFLIPYCEHYSKSKATKRSHASPASLSGNEDGGESEAINEACGKIPPIFNPLSLLMQMDIEKFQRKCLQLQTPRMQVGDELPSSGSASSAATPPAVQSSASNMSSCFPMFEASNRQQKHALWPMDTQQESENLLFGRLIAKELDKLPTHMHNLVRAQVLFFLAQVISTQQQLTDSSTSNPIDLLEKFAS